MNENRTAKKNEFDKPPLQKRAYGRKEPSIWLVGREQCKKLENWKKRMKSGKKNVDLVVVIAESTFYESSIYIGKINYWSSQFSASWYQFLL